MFLILDFWIFLLIVLSATAQTVRFRTTQGDIDVQLFPQSAPLTVANFLNYVNKGAYNNTFFHRSVRNFIIQAGGYRWADGKASALALIAGPRPATRPCACARRPRDDRRGSRTRSGCRRTRRP